MGTLDYNGLTTTFHRYYRRLVAFACKYVDSPDEAEDIVQDCMARLWEQRSKYSDVSTGGLLYTMVRNSCLDYLKHRYVALRFESELLYEKNAGSDSVWDLDFFGDAGTEGLRGELERIVMKEVERLPERCRDVFRLSRFGGLSNREIAKKLEISDAAVHKHLKKAMERLSAALKE
ncbi:MAG: RNA polymerase sigma-70 factor [Bacteroidales bacterium]|nr:RNA polymerase sigma-70 factor [Bacteroidales bacterium]